ncbi:MAG: C69 family dipeptidase [Muribaculaceae bacterium]|nr:C69 family dipeptidase [Muribaculaceae bacterium]
MLKSLTNVVVSFGMGRIKAGVLVTMSLLSFSSKADTPFYMGDELDNCFAILAGKNITADGSVLLAHNEDDSGEQMVNIYLTQPEQGIAQYFWCELPKQTNSDSFFNKYGVAVASDYCPSIEDRRDYTDGGTVYLVRKTVAERARTAREGVKVAGEVVERLGYNDTGRTYLIADADEAWMISVMRGRHWVAQRIPDDKVVAIPNNYVIDKINLADTVNFMACDSLIEYAVERGWYDSAKDGDFSFKRVYGREDRYRADHNVLRHRSALQTLTGNEFSTDPDTYPFSFDPKHKVTVEDMIEALSSHKSETDTCHVGLICSDCTVYSTIFQLRKPTAEMLPEVANVMWLCIGHPCTEPYIPWYLGMTEAPENFGRYKSYKTAQEQHFKDTKDFRKNYPDGYYWKVVDRFDVLNKDWSNLSPAAKDSKNKLQKQILDNQEVFENSLVGVKGQKLADILNNYASDWYGKIK